jgi:hypothetical protein
MSRLLTKRERVDLRHYLQVLTEQARAVRNAIEPDTGVLAITDEAWAGQWAALTRDLDSVTERITGPATEQGGIMFESHRWYTVVRQDGKFLRAFAGGREFSGLGEFEDEEEFNSWRKG